MGDFITPLLLTEYEPRHTIKSYPTDTISPILNNYYGEALHGLANGLRSALPVVFSC
jgi:hypothetical protein